MHDDDIDDTVVRRPRVGSTDGPVDGSVDDPLGDTVIRPIPPIPGVGGLPAARSVDDTVIRPVPNAQPDVAANVTSDATADALADTVIRPVPPLPGGPDRPTSGSLDDTVVRPGRAPRPGSDADDDTVVRVRAHPTTQGEATVGVEPRLPSGGPAPTTRVPSVRIGDRVIRLDHPVIVGRRPALPRVLRGAAPELVSVPSSRGQVSSSHVMLHAEGEAAVVDDLRSTNGTVVRPPGSAPFRMPAGASNVVLTGTVVEIGDGNVIEVLSPHLRVAPSSRDLPPLPPWPTEPPAGTPRTPRERS
ncbi:hypothetical protein Q7F20_07300 [Curtobacterium sp. A7_M15]|uniref:hypothetical protein n=1 Tax=Curtobacterium sp. A7_M15 TaxID=3065241 RepID=UPI002737FE5A|nr:hypothetical protein [Curtobacterium sp. A7_M15]MDP4333173.1 hypothetical protein [Curtobacterium sp. A7_M15]